MLKPPPPWLQAMRTAGHGGGFSAPGMKKKKKKGSAKPGVHYACGNLGTACGNTAVCQCRLNKSSSQVCMNVVTPPNGINFPPCQTNANCGAGQFCDLQFSQCALACPN